MAAAGIKAGAEDLIEKPIDDAQLMAAINRSFTRTLSERTKQDSFDDLLAIGVTDVFGHVTVPNIVKCLLILMPVNKPRCPVHNYRGRRYARALKVANIPTPTTS